MRLAPALETRVEIIVEHLGAGLAPVVPDVGGASEPKSPNKRRQQRPQVVAAAFLEFGEEIRRPVLAADFEAVAEHRVRWIRAARLDLRFGDVPDELLNHRRAVVVHHVALRADRGALDRHDPAARRMKRPPPAVAPVASASSSTRTSHWIRHFRHEAVRRVPDERRNDFLPAPVTIRQRRRPLVPGGNRDIPDLQAPSLLPQR